MTLPGESNRPKSLGFKLPTGKVALSCEFLMYQAYRPNRVPSAGRQGVSGLVFAGETLPARVRYYSRFDLLIIDEFGFDKVERREYPEAASLLFKIIDRRNRRGSTALVSNIEFDSWTEYLGDPPLAMALLDRVVDGALIHEFKSKSDRVHRAQRNRLAAAAQPDA